MLPHDARGLTAEGGGESKLSMVITREAWCGWLSRGLAKIAVGRRPTKGMSMKVEKCMVDSCCLEELLAYLIWWQDREVNKYDLEVEVRSICISSM